MLAPEGALARVEGAPLWGFILLVMLAVICGNIRMIALPTLVTALVEEDRRDKANGLVGMVTGMGFLLTSGISGFLVAWDGIRGPLVLAIGFTALVFLHLLTVRIDDPEPASSAPDGRKERSEERRRGKEWVRTCRTRWSPDHEKKKKALNQYK